MKAKNILGILFIGLLMVGAALMVGAGDRSEKIRTYNYPQNRITDHRIGKSWHDLEKIVNGNLEPVIKSFRKIEKQ